LRDRPAVVAGGELGGPGGVGVDRDRLRLLQAADPEDRGRRVDRQPARGNEPAEVLPLVGGVVLGEPQRLPQRLVADGERGVRIPRVLAAVGVLGERRAASGEGSTAMVMRAMSSAV
jgi:hypothetical protein